MAPHPSFRHVPERAWNTSRRQFLRKISAAMAAPGFTGLLEVFAARLSAIGQTDDEGFWQLIREQFAIRSGFTLMNAANLCPSPFPVSDAVVRHTRDIDGDASFQNRAKFDDMYERASESLAHYMGADADEVVITRNTTEGNNVVVSGTDLRPGDEVVLWDQNHPSNNVSWDVQAQRRGFTVTRVATPVDPKSPDDCIAPFAEALTERTRVLSFSHVSNVSGVALPAKELCAIARERGILTLVDGAQTFGSHVVDLHDLGCDCYTGSAHKWFLGPKEGGILYVRRERAEEIWPLIVGVAWEERHALGARRFSSLGQRDDANHAAVGRTVEFLETVGNVAIEARVRSLATALKTAVAERIPEAEILTPMAPAFSGGVVMFTVPGADLQAAFGRLYTDYQVGCALMGTENEKQYLRFCPHIYNSMDEVDRVVDAVRSLVRS